MSCATCIERDSDVTAGEVMLAMLVVLSTINTSVSLYNLVRSRRPLSRR